MQIMEIYYNIYENENIYQKRRVKNILYKSAMVYNIYILNKLYIEILN